MFFSLGCKMNCVHVNELGGAVETDGQRSGPSRQLSSDLCLVQVVDHLFQQELRMYRAFELACSELRSRHQRAACQH